MQWNEIGLTQKQKFAQRKKYIFKGEFVRFASHHLVKTNCYIIPSYREMSYTHPPSNNVKLVLDFSWFTFNIIVKCVNNPVDSVAMESNGISDRVLVQKKW